MWDLYKKTFLRMQFMVWLVAWTAFVSTNQKIVGIAFLVAMQIGCLFGAMLAARLRRLMPSRTGPTAGPTGRGAPNAGVSG